MDLGLEGRVALVTGASRGIGREVVRRFLEEGCHVVGVSRSSADLAGQAAHATAVHVAGDMTEAATSSRAVEQALETFGRLDIVVNNAAEYTRRSFTDLTREDMTELFELKLLGYQSLVSAAAPHLAKSAQASIVNIAGVAAILPASLAPHAGAINAAVISFSRYLAVELGPVGIRANALSPGATRTDRFESRIDRAVEERGVTREEAIGILADRIPLGRPLEPSEIASVTVFLASAAAAGLTGAHIVMDGGRSASR